MKIIIKQFALKGANEIKKIDLEAIAGALKNAPVKKEPEHAQTETEI